MQYIKVTFTTSVQEQRDMLIALLSDMGYDGFEETKNELFAYISENEFDNGNVNKSISTLNIPFETTVVPAQNWNALWESNFEPVIIDDFCTVRAHFHEIDIQTKYDILITPKMSFGTGHHATTKLMMSGMKDIDFTGKSVLDFGTGTGVLAILSEKLDATDILAIDNDQWSVENSEENISRNNCHNIVVMPGSLEVTGDNCYDIILANINRHILLEHMPALYTKLNENGTLLMSGLLVADMDIIHQAATDQGFHFIKLTEMNNWIALVFNKTKMDM